MKNHVRIKIKAKVKEEADQLTWHDLELGFDQGDHEILIDKKGFLTELGLTIFLDIMTQTISCLVRDASEDGHNEGAIIGAIIKQLEDNLISIEI
jgi:hypothetical protein